MFCSGMAGKPAAGMLMVVSLLLMAGCGGSGGGDRPYGSLTVGLTDKTTPTFSNVFIAVKEVRVVPEGREDSPDTDGSLPVIATFQNPQPVDVLTLKYVQQVLGSATIPAGKYTQVRLILAGNPAQKPYSNYLLAAPDAEPIPLTTPSAQQSGLKVLGSFEVQGGKINAIVLDFDPATAIVKRGNSGQYNLKPTGIRIIQTPQVLNSFASINGLVQSATQWNAATLSLLTQDRVPVAAGTFSSYTSSGSWHGAFSAFVPGGTSYRMYLSSPDFKTYSATVTAPAAGSTADLGTITVQK